MKNYHLCKQDYVDVKRMLSMRQVASFYGYDEDRRHLCTCPFHKDKHPSMKIYPNDKGFYCFACQTGGDVITFVKALYGIQNEESCKKLIEDFSLPISTNPISYRDKREWEKRRKKQLAIDQFSKDTYKVLLKYWILLCEATRDPMNQHFVEAWQEIDIVEYRLECLKESPQEYYENEGAVKKIGEIRERIAGWNECPRSRSAVSR